MHNLAATGAGGVVDDLGGGVVVVVQGPVGGACFKVAVLQNVVGGGLGGLVGLDGGIGLVAALVAGGLGQHDIVKIVLTGIGAIVGHHNAGGGVTVHIEGDGNVDPLTGHIGAVQTHTGAGRTVDRLSLQAGYIVQVIGDDAVVTDGGPKGGLRGGGIAIHLKGQDVIAIGLQIAHRLIKQVDGTAGLIGLHHVALSGTGGVFHHFDGVGPQIPVGGALLKVAVDDEILIRGRDQSRQGHYGHQHQNRYQQCQSFTELLHGSFLL